MDTLEHLTRIASGDEEHIAKLKLGHHGSLPFQVIQALYLGETWMKVKNIGNDVIVAPMSQYNGGEGPARIGENDWWFTITSSHATIFSRYHCDSHMDLWIVNENKYYIASDEYRAAHWHVTTESFGRPIFKELNKRFIARHPEEINRFSASDELVKIALDKNHCVYFLLENPSDEITKYAIQKHPRLALQLDPKWLTMALDQDAELIKKIRNPTEYQIWTALKKNAALCKYVPLTTEMKWFIVRKCPEFIILIKNPTKEMKMYAVTKNASNIQYIKNPTDEMKLEILRNDNFALRWIKNPTDEMLRMVEESSLPFDIEHIPEDRWTDKLIERALLCMRNRETILKWKGLTKEWETKIAHFGTCRLDCDDDILRIAIKVRPGIAIYCGRKKHEKLIRMNPKCLEYIMCSLQSWELCHLAVSLDRNTIIHVKNDEWVVKLKAEFF